MNGRDPHSALKTNVVSTVNFGRGEAVLAQLQWGKSDVAYSLHVNPTTYSSAGLQITDFLAYLGFQRSDQCPFTSFHRCYYRWVDEGFDLNALATALNEGYTFLEHAQQALEACGFFLRQPAGWGFFNGKATRRRARRTVTTTSVRDQFDAP